MTGHPAFIRWPEKAAFGRILPKSKLYEYSHANTRLKSRFVHQVEHIVWQYKLAPETVNLPARPGVPEIQVFGIHVKTPEPSFDVLDCIDQAVQYPIVFELTHGGRTHVAAAYKRPNQADASRWVLSRYFSTGWLPADTERAAMPLALDLGGLYEQLLCALLPLSPRPQEPLANLVARVELAQAKQSELDKTRARMAREKQFNRRVKINAVARKLQQELEDLHR